MSGFLPETQSGFPVFPIPEETLARVEQYGGPGLLAVYRELIRRNVGCKPFAGYIVQDFAGIPEQAIRRLYEVNLVQPERGGLVVGRAPGYPGPLTRIRTYRNRACALTSQVQRTTRPDAKAEASAPLS